MDSKSDALSQDRPVNIEVKCVVCGHRWVTALAPEMPPCLLCMGPVTVVKAERKLRSIE